MTFFSNKNIEFYCKGELKDAEKALALSLSSGEIDIKQLSNLVIGLFQHERYELAEMIFAKWSDLEPNNPEPLTNLGYCLLKRSKFQDAQLLFEHALRINSKYIAAKLNLSDVYKGLEQYDQQLKNAKETVLIKADSYIALNNLGDAYWHCGNVEEAKEAFTKSLQLNPEYIEAKINLAKLMSDEGEKEGSIKIFESILNGKIVEVRIRQIVEFYLSFSYLDSNLLDEGWKLYENGFSSYIPNSLARRPNRKFNCERWSGQPLSHGQKLLIWREQGIGDELRFLSLVERIEIGEGKIIIETDKRLVSLLQRSFKSINVREQTIKQEKELKEDLEEYDFEIPVGSLPKILMRDPQIYKELGGYLKPSTILVNKFTERLSNFKKNKLVGICWRSHKVNALRKRKYSELKDWMPLLSIPAITFVSLQYGDAEAEIVEIEKELGITIIRWNDVDLKDDLETVTALMENLDLIISTSTAVVPLAGALGKKTIFLGHQSWIFLGQEILYPWFKTVKPILVNNKKTVSQGISLVIEYIKKLTDENI